MKYGFKTFSYNNCNLFVHRAVKEISTALATISPYTQVAENVHKNGIKTTADMLFIIRVKGLTWSVIPLPPNQIRQANWLAKKLSKKIDSKIISYQVTYPDKSIQYSLYKEGEDIHSFHYERYFQASWGFQKESDRKDSERKPWRWVRTFFERQKIADLQIEREMIVRNLSKTGFGGEEVDKLKYEITRIDAVYWDTP